MQMTRAAVPSVGAARDDWKIIRALSEVAGVRYAAPVAVSNDSRFVRHMVCSSGRPSFAPSPPPLHAHV